MKLLDVIQIPDNYTRENLPYNGNIFPSFQSPDKVYDLELCSNMHDTANKIFKKHTLIIGFNNNSKSPLIILL